MWAYIGNEGGQSFERFIKCTTHVQVQFNPTWPHGAQPYVITTLIINDDDDDDTNEASRKNVILHNDDVYGFKGIAVIQSIKEYYYE